MRTKHVFPTDEIAHLWMHQTQEDATNPGKNFYFTGDTIYSYGSHFPIARHVTTKRGKVILFTTRTYSVTTAKHLNDVRRAIHGNGIKVFHVYDPTDYPKNHLDDYRKRVDYKMFEAAGARRNGRRPGLLQEAVNIVNEANEYAAFFGLRRRIKMPNIDLDEMAADLRAKAKADRERHAVLEAQREVEYAERRRIDALSEADAVAEWRAGKNVNRRFDTTMLRIKGDQVETSMGARVPIAHAKIGLALVRRVMRTGEEYQANGHTVHLGHYRMDKVTVDGTLYAGCHVITFAEINRIAPALDALEQ